MYLNTSVQYSLFIMQQYKKYLFKIHEYLMIPEEEQFWDGSIDRLKQWLDEVN